MYVVNELAGEMVGNPGPGKWERFVSCYTSCSDILPSESDSTRIFRKKDLKDKDTTNRRECRLLFFVPEILFFVQESEIPIVDESVVSTDPTERFHTSFQH